MDKYQIIAITVISIIAITYIIWQIKKNGLKETAIALITKAEKEMQGATGEEKMNQCVLWIAQLVPMPFNLIITGKKMQELIQGVFDMIKEALDYQPVNIEKEAAQYISDEAETNVKESEGTE